MTWNKMREVGAEMAEARRKAWAEGTHEVVLECGHQTRAPKLTEFGKPNPYGRCGRCGVYQRVVEVVG